MEPKPLSSGLELIPEMNVIDKERDALIISLLAQTISQQDPNPSSFMIAYNQLLKTGLIKNRDAVFWYQKAKALFNSHPSILNLPPNEQDYQMNMMKMRYERDFIPIEKLGHGGFGHVMKCRKKLDHKLYAVKIIPVKNTCKRITEQLKTTLREVISLSIMDHKNVLRYYDAWIEPTWINQFTSPSSNNNNNISKFNMKRGRENRYSDVVVENDSSNNYPMQIMNYPFNEDSENLLILNNDDGEEEEEEEVVVDEEGSEEEDDDEEYDDDDDEKYKSEYNNSRVEVLESTDTQSTTTTTTTAETTTNRSTLTATNISNADYMNNRMNEIIFEDSCSGSGTTTTSTSDNYKVESNNNSVVFEDKKSYSKSNYGDDEGEERSEERRNEEEIDDENSKIDLENDEDEDDNQSTSSDSSSSSGPPIEALNYKKNMKKENPVIDIENEKKNINENINTHKNPSPLLMPCDLVHFTNSKSPPFRQSNHISNNNNNKQKLTNNTPSSDIIPYSNKKSPIYKLKFELSLYIQSEYCEGTTLGKYLSERMDKPNRKVNSVEMYEFLVQIMEGLEHIHSKGIIHRDMKPENIFITNEKKIKIGDFGLATFNYSGIETSSDLSLVSPINNINSQHSYGLGTQLYASPEQLSQSDYDFSTDIYSVGLIVVEMFANFGSMMERALTLKDVRKSVKNIPNNVLNYKPFYLLLPRMLDHNPYNRPKATEILTTLKVYYHSFITPQLTKEVKMIENIKIHSESGEEKEEKKEEEIVIAIPNLLNVQKDINYENCNKEELITLLIQRDLLIVEQQKRIFELEKKDKN